MRFLDANVFLRYLTRDDEAKANACYDLFQRIGRGEEEVVTNELIVAELTYILSSRAHYNLTHDDIRARLTPLLNLRGLELPGKRRCLRALEIYATYPALDFEDAFSIATLADDDIAEIYSYDRDFDQIRDVRRLEP